jgi:hypothetical protein
VSSNPEQKYFEWRAREEAFRRNPESARCCPHPDFARPRKQVWRQRCRTCGNWHRGASLEVSRKLPKHPFARCPHETVNHLDLFGEHRLGLTYQCARCRLCWRGSQPQPYAPGEELEPFHRAFLDEWAEVAGLADYARAQAAAAAVDDARSNPRPRPSGLALGANL